MKDPKGKLNSTNAFGLGIFASFLTVGVLWYLLSLNKDTSRRIGCSDYLKDEEETLEEAATGTAKVKPSGANTKKTDTFAEKADESQINDNVDGAKSSARKKVHAQVEDADRRGKTLFKAKNYLEAAECFSEALDLIQESRDSSLSKQVVTLLNNRSAMYEKGNLAELALVDCDAILKQDVTHSKARLRKMRVLESMERYHDALVEVCAIQLRFMRENRDKLRIGIPVKPPVPQEKIEELMSKLLPKEVEETLEKLQDKPRGLPSSYTIQQLLKSFTGYNSWMAQAGKGSSALELSSQLQDTDGVPVKRVSCLFQRGLRYMYDTKYQLATEDFEAAYALTGGNDNIQESIGYQYHRLLEWVGMARHLRYDLKGAAACYEKCSDLEPENAEILVKRAGVQMDAGKVDEALELFDDALSLDPKNADALLHRSNLRMLQTNVAEAEKDLEACLQVRPNHLLAQLRLATVFMATNQMDRAKECLDKADRIDARSSEVHSYRGEMHFAQNDFEDAKREFEKAIECGPGNPTPYVNAALAIMNSPGENGGPPNIPEVMALLSKSIDVDPMFQAAFVHLGQMKLSMATNLSEAREVVDLYDRGIQQGRTAEELKDLCSMRLLTVAQVEAAESLGMETLNME